METERLSKQCHLLESELCDMKLNAISGGNYATESDNEADGQEGICFFKAKEINNFFWNVWR